MADRRSKRRCVTTKSLVPSAVHYVGYVEDGETPEMIMKKFEELQRIQDAAVSRNREDAAGHAVPGQHGPSAAGTSCGPTGCAVAGADLEGGGQPSTSGEQAHGQGPPDDDGGGLDEASLLEVFKQTSIFNVRAALADNEVLLGADERPHGGGMGAMSDDERRAGPFGDYLDDSGAGGSDLEDDQLAYLKGFWSDGGQLEEGRGDLLALQAQARIRARRGAKRAHAHRQRAGSREPSGPREPKAPREPKGGAAASGQQRHAKQQLLAHYQGGQGLHAALIRRSVQQAGGGGPAGRPHAAAGVQLVQLRMPPPPLPLSWGRTVEPFRVARTQQQHVSAPGAPGGSGPEASELFEVADITQFPWKGLMGIAEDGGQPAKTYQAVMVNSGWELPAGQSGAMGAREAAAAAAAAAVHGDGGRAAVSRLCRLPLPELCPKGFLLVWVHKGLIPLACRQLGSAGYAYVENLTWVMVEPNNNVARLECRPSPAACSHRTLLIFRKEGDGRDIELRHQRSPDVIFDCVRAVDGRPWGVPREVYTTIETMLPTGRGAFLELWAQRGVRRPGWDHVVETPAIAVAPQPLAQPASAAAATALAAA